MGDRQERQQRRRATEFDAFVAGAAGRLLHAAALLTTERPDHAPRAERLLGTALSHTYAAWDRLGGEDPYAHARRELATRFVHHSWRHRRPLGGPLGRLTPRERLVLVLHVYEGMTEEQVAAVLGWPTERVRALRARAVSTLRSRPPDPFPAGDAPAGAPTPPTAGRPRHPRS